MIGIIRDGKSDYVVIKKFISCILGECNDDVFFEFDQPNAMRDMTERYFDKAKKEPQYGLYTDSAKAFVKDVLEIIGTAFFGLSEEKEAPLNNNDLIVLNTDSEVTLGKTEYYFSDWCYTLNSLMWLAIEKFYDNMAKQGYTHKELPLILPFVPFPCIEILVASCMEDYDAEKHRKYRAKPDLKHHVWRNDDTKKASEEGTIDLFIEEYIISDNLSKIYHNIPEARKFIQILSFHPN